MKIIQLFILISVLTLTVNTQTIELSLKDAINHSFSNNNNIKKLENSIDAQDGNIRESYGSLLPDLTFSGGWTRSNQVIKAGTQNIGGFIIPVPETNETTDNFNLSLRSNVTLFDGMTSYDRIDLAKKNKTKLKIQLEKLKQDIALKILADYITILKNEQIVKINEATLEDSRTQLNTIKIFVEVGKRTLSDVYRQDVVVAQNELLVEQAKNNLNKSIADLAFDSNLPLDRNYAVKKDEFFTEIPYSSMEAYVIQNTTTEPLVNNALKNRYDYKSSVYNLSVLQTNLDIIKGTLLFPTLSGFGSYSLSGNKIGSIDNSRVFTIGLTLTYPIFQGFSIDNQRQQAEINYKSAEEDIQLIKNQISLEIKKATIDLKSLLKQIEITDRNLKNAEQDKFLAEESYRVGLGTLLEINTSSVKLNNILIDKSNLIYNFILAQKQLEYYQGLLKY